MPQNTDVVPPRPQEKPLTEGKRSALHSILKEGSVPLSQVETTIPEFFKKAPEPSPQPKTKLIKVEKAEEEIVSRRTELEEAIRIGAIQETQGVRQEISELEKEELSLAQERARILATGDDTETENPPVASSLGEADVPAPQEVEEEGKAIRSSYETGLERYGLTPETQKTTKGNPLVSAYEAAIRRIDAEKAKKNDPMTEPPTEAPHPDKTPELPKIIAVKNEDATSSAEGMGELTKEEEKTLEGIERTINGLEDKIAVENELSPADQAEVTKIVEQTEKEAHEVANNFGSGKPEETLKQAQENVMKLERELEQAENTTDNIAEKIEENEEIIKMLQKQVNVRAEKSGFIGAIRATGEWWGKRSRGEKISFSIGLLLAGGLGVLAGSALVAGAASTGALISRFLGGSAFFVALEARYAKKAEKEGRERTMQQFDRDTLKALLGAALFTGALSGIASHAPDLIEGAKDTVTGFFDGADGTPPAPTTSTSYLETAQQGDSLWSLSERQLQETYGDKFTSLSPEQKTHLIDVIKDNVAEMRPNVDPNTLAIGETISFDKEYMDSQLEKAAHLPASMENFATAETYGGADNPTGTVNPFPEVPLAPEPVVELATPPIDPSLANPEIFGQADEIMKSDMNKLFGTEGIFGIGAQNGMDAISWKDPDVGFSGKTVGEIMTPNPSTNPFSGVLDTDSNMRKFGMESPEDLRAMQGYLEETMNRTGVPLASNENVQDYIRRAAATLISKNPLGQYTV